MKKFYIIISIILVISSILSIIIIHHFKFKNTEANIKLGDDDSDSFEDSTLISLGDFLEMFILASADDIDFNLLKKMGDSFDSIYLRIAENYGVLEEDEVKLEELKEPLTRIDAVKICALCDINIRKKERRKLDDNKGFTDLYELDELAITLLDHVIANNYLSGTSDTQFSPNDYLKLSDANNMLSSYVERKVSL